MKLSHREIIRIIEILGYHINVEGLCYAISLEADIAIVLSRTKELIDRLNFISSLLGESKAEREENLKNNIIGNTIAKAKEKVKNISRELQDTGLSQLQKQQLENQLETCKKIIEIEAFCQNISLAFFPEEYNIFSEKIEMMGKQKEGVLDVASSMISPKVLTDRGGICTVLIDKMADLGPEKTSRINGYFWLLSKAFKEIREADKKSEHPVGIAISMSARGHRISATFDDNKLQLFDSNRLPVKVINLDDTGRTLMGDGKPIFKERSNKLFGDSVVDAPLYIRIKTSKDKESLVKRFLEKYTKELNYFKDGWLPAHYAAYSGDLEILFQLKENSSHLLIADKHGETALSIALKKNHWNVLVYFLVDMTNVELIETALLNQLVLNREKLKNAFLEFLASKNSAIEKEELLSSILNKTNVLGQILILANTHDSISFELMRQADMMSPSMRLFNKPKHDPSQKLQSLARQFKRALDGDHSFLIDHLSNTDKITTILNFIVAGLFSEKKSEMEENAAFICNALKILCDRSEIINENLQQALSMERSVQLCLKLQGLEQAIYMNCIRSLARVYDEIKDSKNKENPCYSADLLKIIDFYSKPACLQKMLHILAEAKPEMRVEVQHAYASLNLLYKNNSKIRECFKKLWSDHPEAIDYMNMDFELHQVIPLLTMKMQVKK